MGKRKTIFKGTVGELKQVAKSHGMFELEVLKLQKEVKDYIKDCEGKHIQQVCYSTYHDALTQICFNCKKIRTSLSKEEIDA